MIMEQITEVKPNGILPEWFDTITEVKWNNS